MKTKKKTAVWFIWMFLLLYLTVWITGIQVKAEDAEPAVAAQVGTITVYNDVNHNGHYYYYKDGIPITVYCYHHDRKQPSQSGTSGYVRYDYFSEIADEPWQPVTKEMIATALYLGYPANATGLMERWNISKWDAIDKMQEVIWAMVKGDRTDYLKDYSYPYDLQYYAQNVSSPYFNKIRNTGAVELSSVVNGKEETDGRFRSETLTVSGDFTGTFGFDTLPQGVHIYDAATDTEITGKQNLEVGKQFYIRYTGQTDVSVLQLSYSYDTHEVFYLKTNNSVYQDMVGTEVKSHTGTLELHLEEEATVSHTVTKKWEDTQNQDGVRPTEIKVQLKADGISHGEPVVLNEANGWSYRWENLPESKDGKKIQYTAEEVNTPDGYTSSYEESDGETVITNTHVPESISKTVTKLWKDDNNRAGKRPNSIQVQLKANGTVKETVEITEKNGWKYTWEHLPKYQGGQEIVYTVEEMGVPDGYEVTIDQKKLEITNTILKKKLQIQKKDKDSGEILQGAFFRIEAVNDNGGSLFEEIKETDRNGLADFSLPYGTYQIVELEAPEGYIKLEEPIDLIVDADGIHGKQNEIREENGIYTIEIQNQKKETIVLPETGGQGTSHLYQSGMLLILAAVGMTVMYKKKKEYEIYEK